MDTVGCIKRGYVLSSYSITSADDAPERDPASWVLWGFDTDWVLLDSRNDEDFPNRSQERSFAVSNSGSYTKFQLQLNNNSGAILQLAEWKLFSTQGGGNGCNPSPITPYVSVNDAGWTQSSSITVDQGARVQFGPQPAAGSWSWSGPNGYSSSVREAVINNISAGGTYTATYTNDCGAQSSQSWQISVNDGSGDYNLQVVDSSGRVPQSIIDKYRDTFNTVYQPMKDRFNPNAPTDIIIEFDPGYDGSAATFYWERPSRIIIGADHAINHPQGYNIVVHEAFHVVQNWYHGYLWACEGLAEYAQHTYGVNLAAVGWSLGNYQTGTSYDDSYVVTGRFWLWMEQNKSSTFAEDLTNALVNEEYNNTTWWSSRYGKTIAQMWEEYVSSQQGQKSAHVVSSSDIADISTLTELSIYPNPVSDVLNVDLEGEIRNTVANIYTIRGVKVVTQTLVNNTSTIDVSILPKGVYLVLINQNGKIVKRKIIK